MMAGVRLKGKSEDIEVIPYKKLVTKTRAGIESILTWTFAEEGKNTLVTLQVEYKVPIPFVGKLAENVIVAFNEMDINVMLQNLKHQVETF